MVVQALASLRKGGVVAVSAIHLDQMPASITTACFGVERQIRSVTNMTRADAADLLEVARHLNIRPKSLVLPLASVNEALKMLSEDREDSSIVLVP